VCLLNARMAGDLYTPNSPQFTSVLRPSSRIDEDTEAQRGEVTCPRSHSWLMVKLRFESEPRFSTQTLTCELHEAGLSLSFSLLYP
jgi:hypothetical protein